MDDDEPTITITDLTTYTTEAIIKEALTLIAALSNDEDDAA